MNTFMSTGRLVLALCVACVLMVPDALGQRKGRDGDSGGRAPARVSRGGGGGGGGGSSAMRSRGFSQSGRAGGGRARTLTPRTSTSRRGSTSLQSRSTARGFSGNVAGNVAGSVSGNVTTRSRGRQGIQSLGSTSSGGLTPNQFSRGTVGRGQANIYRGRTGGGDSSGAASARDNRIQSFADTQRGGRVAGNLGTDSSAARRFFRRERTNTIELGKTDTPGVDNPTRRNVTGLGGPTTEAQLRNFWEGRNPRLSERRSTNGPGKTGRVGAVAPNVDSTTSDSNVRALRRSDRTNPGRFNGRRDDVDNNVGDRELNQSDRQFRRDRFNDVESAGRTRSQLNALQGDTAETFRRREGVRGDGRSGERRGDVTRGNGPGDSPRRDRSGPRRELSDAERHVVAAHVRDDWHRRGGRRRDDLHDTPFGADWWRHHSQFDVHHDIHDHGHFAFHFHLGLHHRHYQPYYWWRWAPAPRLTTWVTYDWATPYYWDYGPGHYIYCANNVIYVNGVWFAPAPVYYRRVVLLAQSAPEFDVEQAAEIEWLPLGVFALVPEGGQQSDLLVQLAVTNDGVLGGTVLNEATGQSYPVEGMVDRQTQQAAWTYVDEQNQRVTMETGIYNLTRPEATTLVHFGPERMEVWQLVRLEQPADGQAPSPAANGATPVLPTPSQ